MKRREATTIKVIRGPTDELPLAVSGLGKSFKRKKESANAILILEKRTKKR
jgi:hypothetical protein